MTSRIQSERMRAMAFPRVFDTNKMIVGLIYLAAYAVLDWISFIEPYAHLGITPWNPGTENVFPRRVIRSKSRTSPGRPTSRLM